MFQIIDRSHVGANPEMSYFRIIAAGGNLMQIRAEPTDANTSQNRAGMFISTSTPEIFESGQRVPDEILQQLTGGKNIVYVEGEVLAPPGYVTKTMKKSKVVPEDKIATRFEGYDAASVRDYTDQIVFAELK